MHNLQTSPAAERATLLLKALAEAQQDISELLASLQTADLTKPTICAGWTIRDQVGHILDATEFLTQSLEKSSTSLLLSPPRPSEMADAMALAARKRAAQLPLTEMQPAFMAASHRLLKRLEIFHDLGWESQISHPYLGASMAVQIAGFALLDWLIHPWDIREALGLHPQLRLEHAALLVPGLLSLLPIRLNVSEAGSSEGRFRFLVEKPGNPDKIAYQLDVVLSSNIAYIERNVPDEVTPNLTFRGQSSDLALAMLGRRPLSHFALPAPGNDGWLARWSQLWISL